MFRRRRLDVYDGWNGREGTRPRRGDPERVGTPVRTGKAVARRRRCGSRSHGVVAEAQRDLVVAIIEHRVAPRQADRADARPRRAVNHGTRGRVQRGAHTEPGADLTFVIRHEIERPCEVAEPGLHGGLTLPDPRVLERRQVPAGHRDDGAVAQTGPAAQIGSHRRQQRRAGIECEWSDRCLVVVDHEADPDRARARRGPAVERIAPVVAYLCVEREGERDVPVTVAVEHVRVEAIAEDVVDSGGLALEDLVQLPGLEALAGDADDLAVDEPGRGSDGDGRRAACAGRHCRRRLQHAGRDHGERYDNGGYPRPHRKGVHHLLPPRPPGL